MFFGHRIAVVIPAYNEADKIARAVSSVPDFVDHIVVVDDASTDGTGDLALSTNRHGLELLTHAENSGVGAAIATGYRRARALGADATAVMAGDSQMDPRDLPTVLHPVVSGNADYCKGNRFLWPQGWRAMPPTRLLGNVALSWLTRLSSGYWRVFDSQCGYTAANTRALGVILSGSVFARYGYPNDLLARLGAADMHVKDVPVRPVYGPDWRSGIRIARVIGPIARLLWRGMVARLLRSMGRPHPLRNTPDVAATRDRRARRDRGRGDVLPAA